MGFRIFSSPYKAAEDKETNNQATISVISVQFAEQQFW